MTITNNQIAKYLSIFVILTFTLLQIFYKQTTVFYVLYLFWFDELIRTISDRITYHFKRNEIENPALYRESVKQRFFLLFGYFLFIFIFFGLVINRNEFNLVAINLLVLTFQNSFFNLSLVTFVLREIYYFRSSSPTKDSESILSNGIIVLHLSVILGILLYFLVIEKLEVPVDIATLVSIIPFLILKLIFEIKGED